MPILASKMLFVCEKLLDKKIFSSFSRKFGYLLSKKDLEMKSDPFRSDPWFFGSTIRSRSSRRKWIYDLITILKKEDLDPKGSRSDHDLGISGPHVGLLVLRWQSIEIFPIFPQNAQKGDFWTKKVTVYLNFIYVWILEWVQLDFCKVMMMLSSK